MTDSVGGNNIIDDKVVQPLKKGTKKAAAKKIKTTAAPVQDKDEEGKWIITQLPFEINCYFLEFSVQLSIFVIEEEEVIVTDSPHNDLKSAVLNLLGGDSNE